MYLQLNAPLLLSFLSFAIPREGKFKSIKREEAMKWKEETWTAAGDNFFPRNALWFFSISRIFKRNYIYAQICICGSSVALIYDSRIAGFEILNNSIYFVEGFPEPFGI